MRKKKGLILIGLLVISLLISGCFQKPEIAAKVNGIEITEKELEEKLNQEKNMLKAQGYDFSGEEGKEMLSFLRMEVLNQLVNEILIKEEAKKLSITVSKEEVDNTIEQFKSLYGDELFQELLEEGGTTEAQLKEQIEINLLHSSLFEQVTADVKIEEAEIRDYYDTNKEDLIEYRASHILLMPDEDAEDPEAAKEEARAKAIALIEELDRGADFAELAKEHSADGSAAQGGDLGQYFTKGESPFVPEFTAGTVALNKGEYSKEPVETFFGYHIIKLTDKKESYEELKPSIEALLERVARNEKFNDYFDEVIAKAEIINYLAQEG